MENLINLERFPLDKLGSPEWNALVQSCRDDLAEHGMFSLDGLLRPALAAQAVATLQDKFANHSFLHERNHNIYFSDSIQGLAAEHPAHKQVKTSNRTLCADQLPAQPLMDVYNWAPLQQFLAATMDLAALYPMDDPLASVNVMAYGEGQSLNWHFDRSEFTTTLLLQAADAGGAFEYRTGLRSDSDPNYEGVGELLRGHDPRVQQISLSPGTLNVFKGKNTAHRVTPVEGDTDRVIAVFCYYENPGVSFTDAERLGFYGRTV
ncbi:MAG: 2OG-Fe(II) oxygenase [Rhodobacteraceae bacterium]|nr:2OG-Fe(II) oxygenase [Paracoccaceae bacterium]